MGWRIQPALAYELRICARTGGVDGGVTRGWIRAEDWVERCDLLLARELRPGDHILVFPAHPSALRFLRPLATDPQCLSAFRAVLAEVSSFPPPAGMEDGEILDQLAWSLVFGRVHVTVRLGPRPVAGNSSEPTPVPTTISRSAPSSSPPPGSARERTATMPEPVDVTPPDAPEPGCESCLRAASEMGIPFLKMGTNRP